MNFTSLNQSWDEFNVFVALGLLLVYIAVDAMFAAYTLAVTGRQALRAANIAFFISPRCFELCK